MGCVCDLAVSVVRIFLIVLNFLAMAFGFALLVFGILVQQYFNDSNEEAIAAVSIGIIVLGSFIIIIGFSGCWGAVSKSRCLLIAYGSLILVIVMAEVLGFLLALTMVVNVEAYIGKQMKTAFKQEYAGDQSSQIFDAMQYQFKCCGVVSPEDYLGLPSFINLTVPLSCCDPAELQTTGQTSCSQTTAYKIGCQPQLTKSTDAKYNQQRIINEDNLYFEVALAVGLASIEFISIFFAFCLAQKYKQ